MTDPFAQAVRRYHERTKHHVDRYARSPGYMDWANQPDPFRLYEGAPRIALPLLSTDPPVGHHGLFEAGRPPAPFDLAAVAGVMELSLGLSAWKQSGGSRWALRMNPSSGNLHPTESHLVLPAMQGLPGGVYHYSPLHHCLERRSEVPPELSRRLRTHFGADGFLIGLTSIFWRESWKYGERAFRYCHHDVGHALAALRFAANLFGWGLACLADLSDDAVEAVLGLRQAGYPGLDAEHPDLLAFVHADGKRPVSRTLPDDLVSEFAALPFAGRPNPLSREHVRWEVIYEAAERSRKPATASETPLFGRAPWVLPDEPGLPAGQVLRQRRSATAFDRRKGIPGPHFLAMLDKTLPRDGVAPFDVGLGEPAVHLLIFVHDVAGFPSGLYCFGRNDRDLPDLRTVARPEFLWETVRPGFPLFLLQPGDFRSTAAMVSCHQDIAGSSAFSLGMLARFGRIVDREPFRYRHLFWESGLIGQTLYLAAEAHGVRGTGIGCFFDDAVHELAGITDDRYQCLYHFTIGHPLEDPRLSTLPPYFHLRTP